MLNKFNVQSKRKRASIFKKIFTPVFIVVCLQIVIFFVFVFFGKINYLLERNTYSSLQGIVLYRAKELEYKMQLEWSNLNFYAKIINETYGAFLKKNKVSSLKNNELEIEFLKAVCPQLEGIIRANKVNGVYLIICRDGDEVPQDISRNAIAISDLDPTVGSEGDEDITTQIAPCTVAEKMGHILGINWITKYNISLDDGFYFSPLKKNSENPSVECENLGYWDFDHAMPNLDFPAISYSIPLKQKNGKSYAVLGIEVSRFYISTLLPFNELVDNAQGAYAFGLLDRDGKSFFNISDNGYLYDDFFKDAEKLRLTPIKRYRHIQYVATTETELEEEEFIGSMCRVHFRDKNRNYEESEKLALMGIVNKKDLFEFNRELFLALIITSLISLMLGIIGILFVANVVSRPIVLLTKKLKRNSSIQHTNLKPTGINEIDELIFSIEDLSLRIKESQKSFSRIIEMSNLPIGAFEYDKSSKKFYFTDTFFKLFELSESQQNTIKSITDYNNFIFSFEKKIDYRENKKTTIYKILKSDGSFKYLRYKSCSSEKKKLGIVMDITKEIVEKKKIEKERDTDLLTKLFNRRAFMTQLKQIFASPNKIKKAAILMMDVNRLKYINDNFGHKYGDKLLQQTAVAIDSFSDSTTITGRLSGDEFVIFSYGFDTVEAILKKINDIENRIESSTVYLPTDEKYPISISGGYAIYPDDGTNYHRLLGYADTAMYEMKKEGLKRFIKYGQE